jgi:Holliday junction resolvase RusA-like endonuclease
VTKPVSRPDADQYMKLLMDALERFLYEDDAQITTIYIAKRFGTPPRIEFEIIEDTEE